MKGISLTPVTFKPCLGHSFSFEGYVDLYVDISVGTITFSCISIFCISLPSFFSDILIFNYLQNVSRCYSMEAAVACSELLFSIILFSVTLIPKILTKDVIRRNLLIFFPFLWQKFWSKRCEDVRCSTWHYKLECYLVITGHVLPHLSLAYLVPSCPILSFLSSVY